MLNWNFLELEVLNDYTDIVLQLYMNQTFKNDINNIYIFKLYIILENVLDEYEVDIWIDFAFRWLDDFYLRFDSFFPK